MINTFWRDRGSRRLEEKTRPLEGQPADRAGLPDLTRRGRP